MATANVNLPEGMSAEKFLEIIKSYEAKKVTGAARNKTKREATTELIKLHKSEYDTLVVKHTPAPAKAT